MTSHTIVPSREAAESDPQSKCPINISALLWFKKIWRLLGGIKKQLVSPKMGWVIRPVHGKDVKFTPRQERDLTRVGQSITKDWLFYGHVQVWKTTPGLGIQKILIERHNDDKLEVGERVQWARQEEGEKDWSFTLRWLLRLGRKLGRQRAVWNATHPASPWSFKGNCGGGKKEKKEADIEREGR